MHLFINYFISLLIQIVKITMFDSFLTISGLSIIASPQYYSQTFSGQQFVVDQTYYVNYLILGMLSDKISLIDYLKSKKTQQVILLEQVLVIIHENAITLHEARRFLLQKNIERYIDWRKLSVEDIVGLSKESYRFVINNRPYWLQQRKIYQSRLLKFHQLQSKITQQDEQLKQKPKLLILQQLKDKKGKNQIYRGRLDEEDYSLLILQLEGIVQFQQQADTYIFSNDYESNQCINQYLEQIAQKNIKESLIKSHLRKHTLDSPIKKIKTSPASMTKSKSIGQLKRKQIIKQSLSRNNSDKNTKIYKDRKNFIHQIREQIRRQQYNKSLSRSISEKQSISHPGSSRLVSVHLPKILKLSDEVLSTQGIYKSLKKFANFDYVAQQKKIRDIIGISLGEEEEIMSEYFTKQRKVKQQKQFQQHMNRQQRRKKILEGLAKKQHHHCKKYNPEEVQPYMRF